MTEPTPVNLETLKLAAKELKRRKEEAREGSKSRSVLQEPEPE